MQFDKYKVFTAKYNIELKYIWPKKQQAFPRASAITTNEKI